MYSIKFELKDKVFILPLHKDLTGRIISIWITSIGIRYETRYFWENKMHEVYFFEDELEKISK